MYLTAHRVVSPDGQGGTNSFLHRHGPDFPWPEDAWRLPEEEPGDVVEEHIEVAPGGNAVRSYLDILAPDGTSIDEFDRAVAALVQSLNLAAMVTGEPLPNPVVYAYRDTVIRFGVVEELFVYRLEELEYLYSKLLGA